MGQNLGEHGLTVRHWCDQHDGIQAYGWMMHDGVNFGVQHIQDKFVHISNSFVKRQGDENGGDWTAEVQALPLVSWCDPEKIKPPTILSVHIYTPSIQPDSKHCQNISKYFLLFYA